MSELSAKRLTTSQKFAADKYATIDSAIDLLNGLRFTPDGAEHAGVAIPGGAFSGAWIHLHELEELHDSLVYTGPDVLDLWPIDVRFGSIGSLDTVKTVTLREVRGRVLRPMHKMIRQAKAFIQNGRAYTSANYYGVRPDNSLVNITNPRNEGMVPITSKRGVEMVYAFAGFQMTAEYLWSVEIKKRGGDFSVRIPTDPEGARRLLSLRDVDAGESRRRALKHWVNEHSRRLKRPDGETDLTTVKAHMRGITPFKWEDFEGHIRPSAYDMRRWAESGGVR